MEMRHFDHNTTWKDVEDMTVDEATSILSRYAKSDGSDWSPRPHMAKACQMAIEALKRFDSAVQHGRWINDTTGFSCYCSYCKYGRLIDDRNPNLYCSHCGARMDMKG